MTERRISYQRLLVLMLLLLSFTLVGCMGQLGTSWAGLTVLDDGNHLVYAYENTLAVFDIADGREPIALLDDDGERIVVDGEVQRWEVQGRQLDNAQFFAAPAQLSDEFVLVPSADGRLFQFDLETAIPASPDGVLIQERGNVVADPLLTDDTIFVGLQGELLALDRDSFEPRWSAESDHAVWSQPLIVDETTIYFVSLDHFLYSVDYESGARNWRVDLGGAAASTPTYDAERGVLYVGTFGSEILAIDAASGDTVARYETAEWVWGAPVLLPTDEGTALFAADLSGMVYRLDPDTLTDSEGWRSGVAEGAIRTPPVSIGDYVVVGSRDQNVYWINKADGAVELSCQLDGEVLADILYFQANEDNELEEDIVVVSTLSNRDALVAFTASVEEDIDCENRRQWTYRR